MAKASSNCLLATVDESENRRYSENGILFSNRYL